MKAVLKFIKIFVLTFVGIIAALLIIAFLLPSNNKKSEKTPTPEMLIQAQNPTATEEITIPDFCKDLQLPLTMTADKQEAEGFPHVETWDQASRICLFSLRDTKSFLNMDILGYISFKYTETGKKEIATVSIDYKESDRIQEIYKDWSITVISEMTGIDLITAKELFTSATNGPLEVYDHYLFLAELNREHMEYRFSVTDMNFVEE